MRAFVMSKPPGITRRLQPAGSCKRPLWYTDGFCLRLPHGRILLVDWCLPREVRNG